MTYRETCHTSVSPFDDRVDFGPLVVAPDDCASRHTSELNSASSYGPSPVNATSPGFMSPSLAFTVATRWFSFIKLSRTVGRDMPTEVLSSARPCSNCIVEAIFSARVTSSWKDMLRQTRTIIAVGYIPYEERQHIDLLLRAISRIP